MANQIKVAATEAPATGNPASLLKWFLVYALVSLVAVVGLVGYGTYTLHRFLIVNDAQYASVGIGKALLERERELFVTAASGTPQIAVDPAHFGFLDERMRKYLIPFNMYKIKLFDANKKIVYSTDRSIINKVDDKNERLQRTLLKGEVIPKMESKDKLQDLAGEQKMNAEIVETYLPIRDENNLIIGAFEVYTDVSGYKKQMTQILALVLTVTFGVMALVVIGLFIPMRKGVFQLEDAQEELQRFASARMGRR